MKRLLRKNALILALFTVVICCITSAAWAASVLRLTNSGVPKYGTVLTKDGSRVFWIEINNAYDFIVKTIKTDGSDERTLLTSNHETGIAGLQGPHYGLGLYKIWFQQQTLKASEDGSKVAIVLYELAAGVQYDCLAMIDTTAPTSGNLTTYGLPLPSAIQWGRGMGLPLPDMFDLSPDGQYIAYTLYAYTSLAFDGTEAGSAVIRFPLASPSSAAVIAGFTQRGAGDYAGVSFGSAPYHVGSPAYAGSNLIFAGNNNQGPSARTWTNLFLWKSEAGVIPTWDYPGDYVIGVGQYGYVYPNADVANFIDLNTGGHQSFPVSGFASSPFYDLYPALVEAGIGIQTDTLSIRRPWGADVQLRYDDLILGTNGEYKFGTTSWANPHTYNYAAQDGSKILFSMTKNLGGGGVLQDLFVLTEIVTSNPPTPGPGGGSPTVGTPTPDGTATVTPSPTGTATPAVEPSATLGPLRPATCTLTVSEECRSRPVKKRTKCVLTITGKDRATKRALSSSFELDGKAKGHRYGLLYEGALNKKGVGKKTVVITQTMSYRARLPEFKCRTKEVTIRRR